MSDFKLWHGVCSGFSWGWLNASQTSSGEISSMQKVSLIGAVLVMLSPFAANATLIGSGVTATYHFNDLGDVLTTGSTTVTDAIEWQADITEPWGNVGLIFESIDFTGTSIIFDFVDNACCAWNDIGTYNGWTFDFDSGVLLDLTAASFAPNSFGYVDSMISWTGDTLFVNWRGGGITDNPGVTINLEYAAVPEPATVSLLGLGLFGFGLMRWRKRTV